MQQKAGADTVTRTKFVPILVNLLYIRKRAKGFPLCPRNSLEQDTMWH